MTLSDKQLHVNPDKIFHEFRLKYGFDTTKKVSFDQLQLFFITIIDLYLKQEIPLIDLYNLTVDLDFTDYEKQPGNESQELDEIIEHVSEITSYPEVLKQNYPYDWAFREALRYYKKHRNILE